MADKFWGRIEIGGTLSKEDLSRFCKAAGVNEENFDQHIEAQHFVIDENECPLGEYPELETLCRDLGLPYIRQSDGMYDYSPEYVFWTPTQDEIESIILDHSGELQTPMHVLRSIRESFHAGQFDEVTELLERNIIDLPELPPFQLAA